MIGRSTRHSLEKDKSFKFSIGNIKGGNKESNLPNIHGRMQETSVQFMQKPYLQPVFQQLSNSPKNINI